MPRPRCQRIISFNPNVTYFKPQGIPMLDLEVVHLTLEEIEAVGLKNLEELDQKACAERMGTSQSTLQRILVSANQKIADALIHGKAIAILTDEKTDGFKSETDS